MTSGSSRRAARSPPSRCTSCASRTAGSPSTGPCATTPACCASSDRPAAPLGARSRMARVRRPLSLLAPVLALVAAGCGSSGSDGSAAAPPPARQQDFPAAAGKTLQTLRAGLPDGVVLTPSTPTSLEVGTNRLGFGLFTADQKQIPNAQVAVYTTDHDGGNVKGPYLAKWESLAVKPQFLSQTAANDPDAAHSVYVARVPVDRPGKRVFTGVARIRGKLVQTSGFEVPVPRPNDPKRPIDTGQQAPMMHTRTLSDVGGDASKLSTRVPPAKDLLK